MDTEKLKTELLREVIPAVKNSVKLMEESLGGPLLGYALCTDSDLRTIYSTGYSEKDLSNFKDEHQRFNPAEWVEHNSSTIKHLSDKLEKLVGSYYSDESDDINPDDDHLRPWKKKIYFDIVTELAKTREMGLFSEDATLLFTAHDCNDHLLSWMLHGMESINPSKKYAGWRSFIKYWFGE